MVNSKRKYLEPIGKIRERLPSCILRKVWVSSRYPYQAIVPGSRWNIIPPGTITPLALPETQRLKPPLE